MMKAMFGLSLFAAVFAGVLLIQSRSTQSQDETRTVKIAFVDVKKAIDGYEKTRWFEKTLD